MQQRLAARQNQHRHFKSLQIIHHCVDFRRGQLARKIFVRRRGVAMFTSKITAANQIPNHHRRRWLARRFNRGRCDKLAHVLAKSKHGI